MEQAGRLQYESVSFTPVKSFFVSMLTRDISLEEAILDLVDNCVDGILRLGPRAGDKPYQGYWANIEFNKDLFSIFDNCGGIPWALHKYAFAIGRARDYPADVPGTVGVYGVGMKRAVLKMGKSCMISTKNRQHEYEIRITPDWVDKDDVWDLDVNEKQWHRGEDGTEIVVGDLYDGIKSRFGEDAKAFGADLESMVSTHYAYIIDKGFEVRINGKAVPSQATRLVFQEEVPGAPGIRPFVFKTKTENDVDVFLTVGFYRSIPSQTEIDEEIQAPKYSSQDAGWTVLCNDRAVLYHDRSLLTGWGEAGVPRYHTQFIAIAGIVEFKSPNASKLPTTTTKRGIDASSSLYLQVKNKMREGMAIFTSYTNRWKGREDESRKQIESGSRLSLEEIKDKTQRLTLSPTRGVLAGEQYRPQLPTPKRLAPSKRRISFVRDADDIAKVAVHLFGNADQEPSEVGGKCFDLFLEEAN